MYKTWSFFLPTLSVLKQPFFTDNRLWEAPKEAPKMEVLTAVKKTSIKKDPLVKRKPLAAREETLVDFSKETKLKEKVSKGLGIIKDKIPFHKRFLEAEKKDSSDGYHNTAVYHEAIKKEI